MICVNKNDRNYEFALQHLLPLNIGTLNLINNAMPAISMTLAAHTLIKCSVKRSGLFNKRIDKRLAE